MVSTLVEQLARFFLPFFALLACLSPACHASAPLMPWSRRAADNITNIPAAVSFGPSRYWDGNDGTWSSFALQVGTPPQVVRVFPSTTGYNNFVVDPQGCPSFYGDDCVRSRGGIYAVNASSTSKQAGVYNLKIEERLGIDFGGTFAFDSLTLAWLGSGGPTVASSIQAAYIDPAFWLGTFGLSPQPTNFSNFNDPQRSFMSALKSSNSIPSLAYGYTAGNPHRLNGVYGSLTLGGVDTSRYEPTDVNFPMDGDNLIVNVQSIDISVPDSSGSSHSTVVSPFATSFPAIIDSTLPFLYLPTEACGVLERAFGLTYNTTSQYYFLNQTVHDKLVQQGGSVNITLGPQTSGGPTVVISLPYAAFDHNVTFPIMPNLNDTSWYFPVRCTSDSSKYTLGRTFLQEAYLIADYDRRNFTVAPCTWSESSRTQQIRSILSPEWVAVAAANASSSSSSSLSSSSSSDSGGVPVSTIAGASVGGAAAVLVFVTVALVVLTKRRRRREREKHKIARRARNEADYEEEEDDEKGSPDAKTAGTLADSELSGSTAIHEMGSRQRNELELSGDHNAVHELIGPHGSHGVEVEGRFGSTRARAELPGGDGGNAGSGCSQAHELDSVETSRQAFGSSEKKAA